MLLLISPLTALTYLSISLAIYLTLSSIRRSRRLARAGCLPIPTFRSKYPLGIDTIIDSTSAIREGRAPEYLRSLLLSNGSLTCTYRIGLNTGVFTADEAVVQAVLTRQFADFEVGDERTVALGPLLGSGIFIQDGEPWRRSRGMLRPAFTRAQISRLDVDERHVRRMMEEVCEGGDGSGWTGRVDLLPMFYRMTMDFSVEFLFGLGDARSRKLGGPARPTDAEFAEAFDRAMEGAEMRYEFLDLGKYVWPRGFAKACELCHLFVDNCIADAFERLRSEKASSDSGDAEYDFFRDLAAECSDPLDLRFQLLSILFAGRDTTAALLGWIFFALARDPDCYRKLRGIVIDQFGSYETPANISFETLKSCKYLQYVVNETLRLYPVVPFNAKRAVRDTTLPRGGGPDGKAKAFVPKGTTINFSVYIMHRRKDIWGQDAEEFKPERWEGKLTGWEYLPFNGGPRICIGQQLALTRAGQEFWLAKPLVYTPEGSPELVITASEMNIIRIFDSKTGNILKQRTLQAPFSAADSNCGDIPNWIGVTGTPIIDPATDIMYVFSKGYRDGTTSGTANGVYKMYAIRIPTLEDVDKFPVLIDGINADNDPAKYFVGGVALQRPSLAELNGHIVAAFGSHCGRWNYTGYLVSVSKTPGVGPVSMWATEAAPGAPKPQPLALDDETGGKAGIWQSGMGLPVIGNNIYFVSGNGQGHANGNVPASGRVPMSTLDECTVRMELSPAGKLSLIDYFQPYDYVGLDAGDRDVGSSGLCVLDPAIFKGTGVNRMCVTAGKKGRVYVMNADNLGGFRQAADGGDGILQTIELGFSLYGGFGSYPGEGGYIYATTVGGPLVAYKLGFDAKGAPQFTLAGKSTFVGAGRVGVGQMTITSDNGEPGTGIVWVADVNAGLQAFRAVPQDGVMVPIPLPSTQGSNKFQRPVFGNGRVFMNVNNNKLVALGSPVNQAVNCTGPVDFGSVEAGTTASVIVNCKANVALAQVNGCTTADPSFKCFNSTLPQGAVAAGTSFPVNVTWDLSDPSLRIVPGLLSSALTISVSPPAEYAPSVLVSLQGTVVKQGAFLTATPSDVAFGRLVLRDTPDGLTGSALIQNVGNGTLTFTGFAWQTNSSDYANFTSDGSLGSGFSSSNFPTVGSTLGAGKSLTVALRFLRQTPGSYISKITIWSNGGTAVLTLSASVNEAPVVSFELANGAGGWDVLSNYSVAFGNVLAGALVDKQIRVCNKGGGPLTITISKPPSGSQLFALNPNSELTEGTQVVGGSCAIGSVGIHAAPVQPNHPAQALRASWTLSTDGLNSTTGQNSGRHDIFFEGTVVSKQVGPLLTNGTARYQWVGCFRDTTNLGRNLQVSVNTAAQQKTNTLQQCQGICNDRGYILSGVQYHQECWCGGSIKNPSTYEDESLNLCTFDCTGDDTQACGGDNGHMSLYADISAFDIAGFYQSLKNPSSSSALPSSTRAPSGVSSSSSIPPVSSAASSSSAVSSAVSSSNTIGSSVSPSSTAQSSVLSSSSSRASGVSSSVASSSSIISTTTTSSTVVKSSTSSSASPTATFVTSPLNPLMPAIVGGQWQYAGCFKDLVDNQRLFTGASSASDDMSLDKCAAFCSTGAPGGGAFNYFGVEYGRECYCGWDVQASKMSTPEAECSSPCAGSSVGRCGAGFRLSVYNNTIPNQAPQAPQHVDRAGDYQFLGCQTEGVNGRALTGAFFGSEDMTTKACAAFCVKGKWQYMGIEYARECYCGSVNNAGSVPAPLKECDMQCRGNQSEFCGGGNRLDFFKFSPLGGVSSSASLSGTGASSTAASSATSSTANAASSRPSVASSSSSSSSAVVTSSSRSSIAIASSSNSPVVTSSSSLSSSKPSSTAPSSSIVPSVPASTTGSASLSTKLSTSSAASATPTNGYYYVGCYRDRPNGHALPLLFANQSVTPELCIDYANSMYSKAPTPTTKLPYLFLEYHHECYGGSTLDFQGAAVTALVGTKACKNYCYGSVSTFTTDGTVTTTTNTANYCGGAKMFDLYALSTPVAFPTTGGPVVTETA
ncbi:hypothetical protein CkaCkLH20_08606 [Colletotrichum karsti]|uniref:WSC domain-containing protein n=1 Tax=Colletotrichum karsti TaxID=1095194 RepID=A0A9P6LIQ6_9PEZI|nr:uncharacterized protein CkaCkLH20_08606 [Colletotrichum karsti]KAF9873872.1 hypothetical protein CkaCkLH20_08606 [Colletotrichum karsti]